MKVTRVKLLVDQALFGRCFFEGAVFYITDPYRVRGNTDDISDVFDEDGNLLGNIIGWYFDFGNKKVFETERT